MGSRAGEESRSGRTSYISTLLMVIGIVAVGLIFVDAAAAQNSTEDSSSDGPLEVDLPPAMEPERVLPTDEEISGLPPWVASNQLDKPWVGKVPFSLRLDCSEMAEGGEAEVTAALEARAPDVEITIRQKPAGSEVFREAGWHGAPDELVFLNRSFTQAGCESGMFQRDFQLGVRLGLEALPQAGEEIEYEVRAVVADVNGSGFDRHEAVASEAWIVPYLGGYRMDSTYILHSPAADAGASKPVTIENIGNDDTRFEFGFADPDSIPDGIDPIVPSPLVLQAGSQDDVVIRFPGGLPDRPEGDRVTVPLRVNSSYAGGDGPGFSQTVNLTLLQLGVTPYYQGEELDAIQAGDKSTLRIRGELPGVPGTEYDGELRLTVPDGRTQTEPFTAELTDEGIPSFEEALAADGPTIEEKDPSSFRVKLLRPVFEASEGRTDILFLAWNPETGQPLTGNITATLEARMPSMGHGTSPEQDPVHLGDGVYAGMTTFSMEGDWTLRIDLLQTGEGPMVPGTRLQFEPQISVVSSQSSAEGVFNPIDTNITVSVPDGVTGDIDATLHFSGAGEDLTASYVLETKAMPLATWQARTDGLDLSVDASAAQDPDGEIVTYTWFWGDGSEEGSGAHASHTYERAGTYTVRLTVEDDDGFTRTRSLDVVVGKDHLRGVGILSFEPAQGATALVDGEVILVGEGCPEPLDGRCDQLVSYDPDNGSFEQMTATLPEPRKDHGASAFDGGVYIFGGSRGASQGCAETLNGDSVHEHAELEVYLGGEQLYDFSDDRYQLQDGSVHLELGDEDAQGATIHVHEARPGLACFFSTIGWEVENSRITTDDGTTYGLAPGQEAAVFVDGKPASRSFDTPITGSKTYTVRLEETVSGEETSSGDGGQQFSCSPDWSHTVCSDILRFGPGADRLERVDTDLPFGLTGATAVSTNEAIYLFGGRSGPGCEMPQCEDDRQILRFDPNTEEVRVLDEQLPPNAAEGIAATWDGDTVYLLGGYGESTTDQIAAFDPDRETLQPTGSRLPNPRAWGGAIWDGQAVYYLGGAYCSENPSEGCDELVRFDPQTGEVEVVEEALPEGRSDLHAVFDGDAIHVLGGKRCQGTCDEIVSYDFQAASAGVVPSWAPSWSPWALGGLVALGAGVFVLGRRRQREKGAADADEVETDTAAMAADGGRYEFLEHLGRGGGGSVALAHDTLLDRKVVLKRLNTPGVDPEGHELLVREARAAGRINHPNLVQVHDVTRIGPNDVIVMAYHPRGSLADRLEDGPIPPKRALTLALGILRGLKALHDEEMIHRDLKPSNILLADDGTPKIADFGIAHVPGMPHLSVTGAQPGTLLYMSPEQAEGLDVDHRSDIYAFGALFYEMLTGEHYLGRAPETEYKARQAVIEDPPRLPRDDLPGIVNRFLAKCLAKDPDDRFQSVDEVGRALSRIKQGNT